MLIRVETENGLVGYAPGEGSEKAHQAIMELIAPFLIGRVLADADALRVQFDRHMQSRPDLMKTYCTVEVALSGGTLSVAVNGGQVQPIVPQSETNFSGTGLTYRFIRDGQGIATDVIEGHVSGDYTFQRQK